MYEMANASIFSIAFSSLVHCLRKQIVGILASKCLPFLLLLLLVFFHSFRVTMSVSKYTVYVIFVSWLLHFLSFPRSNTLTEYFSFFLEVFSRLPQLIIKDTNINALHTEKDCLICFVVVLNKV